MVKVLHKNIIQLLMLISLTVGFVAHGQLDIKNTLGINVYMDGKFISSHINEANATEKILNLRRQFPLANIEGLASGRLWSEISDDYFSSLSDTITITESVLILETPEIVELDTIMKITYLTSGIDSLNNHTIFGVTKNGKAISLKLQDTLGLSINSLHDKERFESFTMNVKLPRHIYTERNYTFSDGKLNEMFFHPLLYAVRSQDSLHTRTQTYFNKVWWFSKKEANNLEDFKTATWTDFGYNAGHPHPNSWRHTSTFKTKFWQIRAQDTITKEIIELGIKSNSLLKGTLRLTDLRIDRTNDGSMSRVRVTGNEPCMMKLYAKKSDSVGNFILVDNETSYDYSSHGMNTSWIVSGDSYNLMAVGRDINGLDVIIMAQNIVAP